MSLQITNFDKVGDFMEAFGQEVLIAPRTPDPSVAKLRLELIREEVAELQACLLYTSDAADE